MGRVCIVDVKMLSVWRGGPKQRRAPEESVLGGFLVMFVVSEGDYLVHLML